MAILTIGRVGIDVELNHPSEMSESRSIDSRVFSLRGFLRSTSVANTRYLKKELLEQQGQIVSVTYTLDPDYDGFYLLSDSSIESIPTSYRNRGLFLFDVTLFRIGGSSRVEFQSNITGTVIANVIGLLEAEVKPWVAPPASSNVFNWGVTGLTAITRATADGNITVYTSDGDYTADASWGCEPANYMNAAAEILTTSQVRMGLDIPQSPGDWELNNGILRVRPDATDSKLNIAVWDGSAAYESEKTWELQLGGVAISAFSYISAIRNDPEAVTIRLASGGTLARHTIDLTLRRGSPQLYVNWYWSGTAGTLKILSATTEAATAVTPTGATATAGCRATSNDADGNRFTCWSPGVIVNDLTEGGLSIATTNRLNCALGFEIAGSSAISGDTADDLALQYFGMVGERVRAVWR